MRIGARARLEHIRSDWFDRHARSSGLIRGPAVTRGVRVAIGGARKHPTPFAGIDTRASVYLVVSPVGLEPTTT
jgi:hypothetical protein